MNLVSVMNLNKSYGEKILFQDITFGIDQGERIGLIGVNGTGKSSLLKIIAGVDHPDSGQVTTGNGIQIEYLPQNPVFDDNLTVLQSVFQRSSPVLALLGEYEQLLEHLNQNPDDSKLQSRLLQLSQQMDVHNAWELEANAKTILNRLGITNYSSIVGNLSGGERKRVAMARALIRPADLLILDEPTNHIDHETIDWLEGYLSKSKFALLMITHDRYFLDRVVNRILELDKGHLYSYAGNYEKFLEQKAEREEREAASVDKRQNLLRRELAWLQRGAKARTTKQKARVEFVKSLRDQKVEKLADKLEIAIGSEWLGNKVIELTQISKVFENRTLIKDFSCLIKPRDRIGIVGPNGSGKSTLLNIMAGKLSPDRGSVDIGTTVKMAYYTQENIDMDESKRVIEYIQEAASYIKTSDGETISAGQMLTRFLFPPSVQWTPIAKLSGGEKRRLYLLRILMSQPNVLLLDEPTNDLDIQTLTILEDYLDHFDGTVITVSHDRYFLDRVVNRLLAFEGQGKIHSYMGMYSEYQSNRSEEAVHTEVKEVKAKELDRTRTSTQKTSSRPLKLSFKEQREYDTIEETVAELEAKLSEVQDELAKGGTDYTRLQKLMEEQSMLESELNAAVERWAELSELVEEISRNKQK
ncbi:ABC-F family ATP-binding cassette domain-containing protein [Effusibacillus consociatus]|uniref:ABC-F family ATP-binding cassette domain-containing protein n=1 Tax=Effusibacillus consociatus TaxID=1117041 RepID=A0ABV9Q1J1_9BACL